MADISKVEPHTQGGIIICSLVNEKMVLKSMYRCYPIYVMLYTCAIATVCLEIPYISVIMLPKQEY